MCLGTLNSTQTHREGSFHNPSWLNRDLPSASRLKSLSTGHGFKCVRLRRFSMQGGGPVPWALRARLVLLLSWRVVRGGLMWTAGVQLVERALLCWLCEEGVTSWMPACCRAKESRNLPWKMHPALPAAAGGSRRSKSRASWATVWGSPPRDAYTFSRPVQLSAPALLPWCSLGFSRFWVLCEMP